MGEPIIGHLWLCRRYDFVQICQRGATW